ncbi:MAG: gephyrin-like molybdotransferase Glp [Pseudomonadota bacterium]
MTPFDTFAMVDWSSGNDTGPKPRKDAIWAAIARAGRVEPAVYLRNRAQAEDWIAGLIERETAAGRRVLLGFDFPFGYPEGFAKAVTGSSDPLGLWDWFDRHLSDAPAANNRFELAGQINMGFPGTGPFWFNGMKADIDGLPRKGTDRSDHGMPERRRVEELAKGSFSCWQMGGAGAVGGQVMTGMACLARLRRRFPDLVAAWPFEPLIKPVAFVEIWPSLIAGTVADRMADDRIKDAVQVQSLAGALMRLTPRALAGMLDVNAPAEGWILGVGSEAALAEAARLQPPPLKNDCFALPPGVDWLPVGDALGRLRASMAPVVGQRMLPTIEAAGSVLAAPIVARRSNPPAANSAVDGYGFAHAALGAVPQEMPLVEGRAAAGAPFQGRVPPGSAVRILTGALLPGGVDTVVLEEDTTTDGTCIAFRGGVKPGANTRRAGEDVEAGAEVLPAGRPLTPADLALLSAVGVAEVPVFDRLRVGVLSTGDEIVPPDQPALADRTFDANRPMLLAMLGRMGFAAVDLGHVPDDRTALATALDGAAETCDAVLTSGGASAGDEDHVSALLRDTGALRSWRIAVKPGRPLAMGLWRGMPIFGLPGNPVAAFVCTLVFARPALLALSGACWSDPVRVRVPAAFEKRKKPGRREFLRARLNAAGKAEVFASEGSGRISGLSWADGLVELGDGAAHIRPGDPVSYLPYGAFGL